MVGHEAVVEATKAAAAVEDQIESRWPFISRLRWLNEAELVARMHTDLTSRGVIDQKSIRMSAQGKVQSGETNHDLEFYDGQAQQGAVEVLYFFAAKDMNGYQPQQAKYFNEDAAWLLGSPSPSSRHVVAFVPRMTAGYTVQKCPAPFGLDGRTFTASDDHVLLTGVLQATDLSSESRELLADLIVEILEPAAGKNPRWSLRETPRAGSSTLQVRGVEVKRSVVASDGARLWGVVLSMGC